MKSLAYVFGWGPVSFQAVISGFVHQDEPSPPRPEAYPIPTQTYPREYFTIPASKSQDRVVGPGQVPSPHWQGMENRERLPVVDNSMQVEPRGATPRGNLLFIHKEKTVKPYSEIKSSSVMFSVSLPSGLTTPRKICTRPRGV